MISHLCHDGFRQNRIDRAEALHRSPEKDAKEACTEADGNEHPSVQQHRQDEYRLPPCIIRNVAQDWSEYLGELKAGFDDPHPESERGCRNAEGGYLIADIWVDDGPAYTQREPTEDEGDEKSVGNGRHPCTPCPDASRALM